MGGVSSWHTNTTATQASSTPEIHIFY